MKKLSRIMSDPTVWKLSAQMDASETSEQAMTHAVAALEKIIKINSEDIFKRFSVNESKLKIEKLVMLYTILQAASSVASIVEDHLASESQK